MVDTADTLDQGRESFRRQSWGEAYAQLSAANRETPLDAEDLAQLAVAAYLVGRDSESVELFERAYQSYLEIADPARAVRCAFWLGMSLVQGGEPARGAGWLARARRQLDELQLDCVEQGYLLVPTALQHLDGGAPAQARSLFEKVGGIARRFRDPDLTTMAQLGQGQALIREGASSQGISLLDEVMISVTSGELSPIVSGIAYCSVILSCQEAFDLRRAQDWTTALSRWCDAHPELGPFRGQCLVHRSEILQLRGAWSDAMHEADRACERLARPALGMAFYQKAELHRLRGEFAQAEDAYRQASLCGRVPQPGLARLRLAQGQKDAAYASIQRALDETEDRVTRSKLLADSVEIMLAVRKLDAARAAADELSQIALDFEAPLLRASSDHARGAVLLAEGEARAAATVLRRAWMSWQEMDAPYEGAQVRVLLGRACRDLGDEDAAQMELDAARAVFRELGAGPDLAQVEAWSRKDVSAAMGGLTAREVEVLRLVATGKRNRAIATELFLSEKTVARHLSNIFNKLGVSSRAAATAYAYERGLV